MLVLLSNNTMRKSKIMGNNNKAHRKKYFQNFVVCLLPTYSGTP